MGYILLILGIAVWIGAHAFKRVAPERRAGMGDAGKGLVALLLTLPMETGVYFNAPDRNSETL